jgi:hypothetical protein
MNFKKLIALWTIVAVSLCSKADEGMWLPSLLSKINIAEMQSLGAKLTYQDIYDTDKPSIKDAVLVINRGSCTGELVSPNGLFLTNHHCGYDQIRQNSTEENNYLRDGFWAKSYQEELPNSGMTVSFLIKAQEVTSQILEGLSAQMKPNDRSDSILNRSIQLEKQTRNDSHYEVKVEPMFGGNRYFLFVYETFKDVRLVGAPPHFIGKFGGDTDNWMWPRHTGDFTLFRVYTGPDGKPAEYSSNNIPLKSKHFFPISLNGYNEDDFSMVMGFPGSTNRYLTAKGVESVMRNVNDTRIMFREEKLRIIREYMGTSDLATIQYASKHARSSNYYKYSIGQNRGLDRLRIVEQKEKEQCAFNEWVKQDSIRAEKYGTVLESIDLTHENSIDTKAFYMLSEAFLSGPEIFMFAIRFRSIANYLKNNNKYDPATQSNDKMLESVEEFFKNYNVETDKKIVASLTRIFVKNSPSVYHPGFVSEIERKYKGDYDAWAEQLFAKSFLINKGKIINFLNKPKANMLAKDPLYRASEQIFNAYGRARDKHAQNRNELESGYKLYLEGLFEMKPEKAFYPDANSTMRMTYGSISGYEPRDAVYYSHYTTANGYLEKEIPGDREFDVWPSFKEKIVKGDFGRYADENGSLRTCFISNNDITGGNSGSPVINKNCDLIGIAFDGNWEAMSGDIAFEHELQKCINVDIRFVLWVIDQFAGASNIVDEMTLVVD